MGFVISTGMSEIYDILTHLTFLYIEAKHIHSKTRDEDGKPIREWLRFEKDVHREEELKEEDLEQAIWNLSILLGRSYHETKDTYDYLDKAKDELKSNNGLFQIIYSSQSYRKGNSRKRSPGCLFQALSDRPNRASALRKKMGGCNEQELANGLQDRPLHIISANLHSVLNLIYGYAAVKDKKEKSPVKIFTLLSST